MNCLCCGKPINNAENNGWHTSCIKKFFGTSELPKIEIDEETIKRLADESINSGLTVPGVQKKLSLHLTKGSNPRLTLVNYPTGYILKPQTLEYSFLPESEYLVMQMAKSIKINTVPFALIKCGDEYAYITKRVDRDIKGSNISKYAMEDFCQLGGRLTEDKYNSSYEQCAKIIRRYSDRSGLDMTEFFIRLVFCFVVGNSDMHLKNFSLIEVSPESSEYILSPAYDLLPVNIIMPSDKEETALTLCGKKKNLRRKDFIKFADSVGIISVTAEKVIDSVINKKSDFIRMTEESYLSEEMKNSMISLIIQRVEQLKTTITYDILNTDKA